MGFFHKQRMKQGRAKTLRDDLMSRQVHQEWSGRCPECNKKTILIHTSEDGKTQFFKCIGTHKGKPLVLMVA